MSSNHSKAGSNYLPAYQLPAIPFVTSSSTAEVLEDAAGVDPINVKFPFVTKYLTIRNIGSNNLRVAFSHSGSYAPGETIKGGGTKPTSQGSHFFIIPAASAGKESTHTFDVRCKEVFFLANDTGATGFSLFAGLTSVESGMFPVLTASNGFDGIG